MSTFEEGRLAERVVWEEILTKCVKGVADSNHHTLQNMAGPINRAARELVALYMAGLILGSRYDLIVEEMDERLAEGNRELERLKKLIAEGEAQLRKKGTEP